MNEAELIAELATRTEILWGLIQWWASISLALIAASHLASNRIDGIAVIVLVVCYSAYTYMITQALSAQTGFIEAIYSALANLQENSAISSVGRYVIGDLESTNRIQIIQIAFFSLFFCASGFPIFEYFQNRKRPKSADTLQSMESE